MADTTISPNMNLPVPVPSTAPGPDWADDVVADMYAIDSHDHSSGKGVPITPDGINITADLPLNDNNLTEARSVNFTAQVAPIALPADVGCIYVSGADLYYNDTAANAVRITQSGSVTGATGTITGLPSGTASASYSAGTFTFQSATNTPANMAVGPLTIGRNSASPKTVSITPNVSQAANYDLTLPLALPASTSFLTVDSSGGLSSIPYVSSVVADTFTPTVTYIHISGVSPTITTNTYQCYYTRLGSIVTVMATVLFTIGPGGGVATYGASITLPVATASLAASGMFNSRAQFGGFTSSTLSSISNTSVSSKTGFTGINITNDGTGELTFVFSYVVS